MEEVRNDGFENAKRDGKDLLLVDGGRRLLVLDPTGTIPPAEFTEWVATAIMKSIDARFKDPEVQKDFLRWKAERITSQAAKERKAGDKMKRSGLRFRSLIEWPSLWECRLYMAKKGLRSSLIEFRKVGDPFIPKPQTTKTTAFF